MVAVSDPVGWARRLIAACLLAVCLIVAAMATLAAPASADVVTFGSSLPAPSPGYYDSCSESCTSSQIELNGAKVVSPVTGRVVKFRLRTDSGSDTQDLRFRVLHTSNGTKFSGAGTSAAVPISTSAGITEYAVDMPIEKGDYIGIDQPGGGVRARVIRVDGGAFQGAWFPKLGDGKTARASGNPKGSPPSRYELLLQADVAATEGPEASTCTKTKTLVATCADPEGLPAVCGPGAIFPQCHLPLDLPTACGGLGSGLPSCQLPRNEVVACGSLGIGLGVPACGNLPQQQIPQVCGPTTVGLPPCSLANNLVTACGPVSLGFQPCAFKSLIKAPKPIDPGEKDGAELEATATCPEPAKGTGSSCAVTVDLEAAYTSHLSAIEAFARRMSWYYANPGDFTGWEYLLEGYSDESIRLAAAENARVFLDRAGLWVGYYLENPHRSKTPFRKMTDSERNHVTESLRRKSSFAWPYLEPTVLYDSLSTQIAAQSLSLRLQEAVADLADLQGAANKAGEGKRPGAAGAVSSAAATSAGKRPLLERRFKLRRGRRNHLRIRLPRGVVRTLLKRTPRRARAVPVRLAFTFKAKPRPIVRIIDFPLRIKEKRRGK